MTLCIGGSDSTELMREGSGCMNIDGHGQVFCFYQDPAAFQKLFCKRFLMILHRWHGPVST